MPTLLLEAHIKLQLPIFKLTHQEEAESFHTPGILKIKFLGQEHTKNEQCQRPNCHCMPAYVSSAILPCGDS